MRPLLWVLLAGSLAGCGKGNLIFEAKVSDLRKAGNQLAKGKEPEETVRITAPGKMLDPLAPVGRVAREQADWSTPERAAASVISGNAAGDLPWIVRNYVSAERPAAGRQLVDPMAAARTRAYYLNLGSAKLMGWAELGDKRILFLRGDDGDGEASIATMVLAKTDDGWRQTTALARDDRYDVVIAALHHGGVK